MYDALERILGRLVSGPGYVECAHVRHILLSGASSPNILGHGNSPKFQDCEVRVPRHVYYLAAGRRAVHFSRGRAAWDSEVLVGKLAGAIVET